MVGFCMRCFDTDSSDACGVSEGTMRRREEVRVFGLIHTHIHGHGHELG